MPYHQAAPTHVGPRPPAVVLEESGTLSTLHGPITWMRSLDGNIEAGGGGQKLTTGGHEESDGSWHKDAEYALVGEASYLTMELLGDVAEHKVEFTLSAGSSRLTLTVAGINPGVTHLARQPCPVSGTAQRSVGACRPWI